jgi:riboflavin synthase
VTSLTPLDSTVSGGSGTSLTISDCGSILDSSTALGDSISINGTCLTVTEFTATSFKVGLAPETLRRTNLGSLKQGSRVNLERAVSASTRMGGHFVQGHVDCIANITSITPDGNSLVFRLALPPASQNLLRYIVEKGYVTLDGASLTVTAVDDNEGWFEIMLIAYTQERIVTSSKKVGEGVNVEIDVVGKYVEKSVGAYFEQYAVGEDGMGSGPVILDAMIRRIVDERINQLADMAAERLQRRSILES